MFWNAGIFKNYHYVNNSSNQNKFKVDLYSLISVLKTFNNIFTDEYNHSWTFDTISTGVNVGCWSFSYDFRDRLIIK